MDFKVTKVVTVSGNNSSNSKDYVISPIDCKVSRCEPFAKEKHREPSFLDPGYVDCVIGCIF